MLWFVLALIAAITHAARTAVSKKLLQNVDEYLVAWATSIFALPFMIIALFFFGLPKIDTIFWIALLIGVLLNTITTILYFKSIKLSPLSLTVPFLTFTPLFLLITSPIMLGEFPSLWGVIGISLIVFGAYVLNIQTLHKGFLAPFKAIFKEKGSVLMLIVALIFSITANIDKIAILHSNPVFYIFLFHVFLTIIFTSLIQFKSKDKIKQVKKNYLGLILIGFLFAVMIVSQMIAIKLTLVAYVNSVKRTTVIFSVIFGYFFFKEKNFKQCLAGAIIMVIGVVLIGVF